MADILLKEKWNFSGWPHEIRFIAVEVRKDEHMRAYVIPVYVFLLDEKGTDKVLVWNRAVLDRYCREFAREFNTLDIKIKAEGRECDWEDDFQRQYGTRDELDIAIEMYNGYDEWNYKDYWRTRLVTALKEFWNGYYYKVTGFGCREEKSKC